jgi:hypothetical protein
MHLPDRDDHRRLHPSENPDRSTKRDVAKAFNLKGDDRVALKHLFGNWRKKVSFSGAANDSCGRRAPRRSWC